MKHILIVVEQQEHAQPMLKKALTFLPKSITMLVFAQRSQKSQALPLQKLFAQEVKGGCQTTLRLELSETMAQQEEKLISMLKSNEFDSTFLHRPQLGRELLDFSLIKAALTGPSKSSVFLCGNHRWREHLKILATVDIFDTSAEQTALNDEVMHATAKVSNVLNAKVALLSVIPIARFKLELDITQPYDVMVEKGQSSKDKLKQVVQQAKLFSDYTVHIAAGAADSEILSVASKMKTNLVVIGNVARTGVRGLLIGNTAEKILTRLAVDALIVRV